MIQFLCECFELCFSCLQYNNNDPSQYNTIENQTNNTEVTS